MILFWLALSTSILNSEQFSLLNKLRELLAGRTILLHSDCVQSFGKIDIKPISKVVDCLTVSSHKVYGPKGVGAVYINPYQRIVPVFPGGVHQDIGLGRCGGMFRG